MNYKKIGILFLLFLVIGSLSAEFVAAAAPTSQPLATLYDIVTLNFLKTLGLTATIDPVEGVIRFLLLLLLFTVFYEGVKLAGLSKNAGIVIALVFALISAIFVPGTILLAAATGYGTIVSLILVAIPVFICFGGYFFLRNSPWARAVLMSLLVWVLWVMLTALETPASGTTTRGIAGFFGSKFYPIIDGVHSVFWVVFGIAAALAVWSLIAALSTLGGATSTRPNWMGALTDKVKNDFQQSFEFTEKGKELRHAKREETRLLSDLATQKEEVNLLNAVELRGDKYHGFVNDLRTRGAILSTNFLTTFNNEFNLLTGEMGRVNHADQKWKTAERRAVTEMNRLLAEMVNKGVSDDVMRRLGASENSIKNDFTRVANFVRDANRAFSDIQRSHGAIVKSATAFYKSHPPTTPFPVTGPSYARLLSDLNDLLDTFGQAIVNARVAENKAMNDTAAIAQQIERGWVV